MATIARLVIASASTVCTAVGLAGIAAAAPEPSAPSAPSAPTTPAPVGPGYEYYPEHYATAAPTQAPGWQRHHGPNHMN